MQRERRRKEGRKEGSMKGETRGDSGFSEEARILSEETVWNHPGPCDH